MCCVQVFTLFELVKWVCIFLAPIPSILIVKRIGFLVFQHLELEKNWLVQVLRPTFVFKYFGTCNLLYQFQKLKARETILLAINMPGIGACKMYLSLKVQKA